MISLNVITKVCAFVRSRICATKAYLLRFVSRSTTSTEKSTTTGESESGSSAPFKLLTSELVISIVAGSMFLYGSKEPSNMFIVMLLSLITGLNLGIRIATNKLAPQRDLAMDIAEAYQTMLLKLMMTARHNEEKKDDLPSDQ